MSTISKHSGQQTTLSKPSPKEGYQPLNFDHLMGMHGFSDRLLTDHFKLYQGYVTNTNNASDQLQSLIRDGKEKTPQFAEVKRRFGWEWNGMRLHEYYFGNLGGKGPLNSGNDLATVLIEQYGSFENWKKDFIATGAMRGIGWAILFFDRQSGRFFNTWIEQHNENHFVGEPPVLVMDVFEHAYILDYGSDRAKYINAFFENLNWPVISDRYAEAR